MGANRSPLVALSSVGDTPVALRVAILALVTAVALVGSRTWAQRALPPPNFDVRTEKSAGASAYLRRFATPPAFADIAGARAAGLARLERAIPTLAIDISPETGAPEVVGTEPGSGFLTGPSPDRISAMKAFLSTNADVYGLSQNQVASLDLVADYLNPAMAEFAATAAIGAGTHGRGLTALLG